jgi:hypothetical protein
MRRIWGAVVAGAEPIEPPFSDPPRTAPAGAPSGLLTLGSRSRIASRERPDRVAYLPVSSQGTPALVANHTAAGRLSPSRSGR